MPGVVPSCPGASMMLNEKGPWVCTQTHWDLKVMESSGFFIVIDVCENIFKNKKEKKFVESQTYLLLFLISGQYKDFLLQ
jgi:hypothetical protein